MDSSLFAPEPNLFWRAATIIVLAASLAVILGASVALALALIRGDDADAVADERDDDGVDADAAVSGARRAQLDAAVHSRSDLPRVHRLPSQDSGVGSAGSFSAPAKKGITRH